MFSSNLNEGLTRYNTPPSNTSLEQQSMENKYNDNVFRKNIEMIKNIYNSKNSALPDPPASPATEDYLTLGLQLSLPAPADDGVKQQPAGSFDAVKEILDSMLIAWFEAIAADEDTRHRLYAVSRDLIQEFADFTDASPTGHASSLGDDIDTTPPELKSVIRAGKLIDKVLLDIAINLLANGHDDYFSTPALLFSAGGESDIGSAHTHLLENVQWFKDIARKKLVRLAPGQKLMMPLLSLSVGQPGQYPSGSHFSAILAVRVAGGFRFNIFDSNDDADQHTDKERLIDELIEQPSHNELFYYGQQFQWYNDCGIHTYNFFRLCCAAPDGVVSETTAMQKVFEDYIANLTTIQDRLHGDTAASSSLLRIYFALDCIRTGYTGNLYNDPCLLSQIYDSQEPDTTTQEERACFNRIDSLWSRLRRSSSFNLNAWTRRKNSES